MISFSEKREIVSRPVEPEGFLLKDFSDSTREIFLEYLRSIAQIYSADERALVDVDSDGRFSIAHAFYRFHRNQHGVLVNGLSLLVSEEAFLIDSEDNRDLIPIVIEHETAETWVDIYRKSTLGRFAPNTRSRQSPGHLAGLQAEYRLAHQLDVADRYLALTQKWAVFFPPHIRRQFRQENREAYEQTLLENQSHRLR